jgi:hypothetical protein
MDTIINEKPNKLIDNYAVHGTKWFKNNLTWVYLNSSAFQRNQTNLMDDYDVRITINNVLNHWSSVSLLTFSEDPLNKNANIKIAFHRGIHSDGYKFDGFGGILAHGFYPCTTNSTCNGEFYGEVHLDLDENWDTSFLYAVVLHEFGHTFGLDHSSVKESVMYPWYSNSKNKLHEDDIIGISQIYGPKSKWGPNTINPSVTLKPSKRFYQPSKKHFTTKIPYPTKAIGKPRIKRYPFSFLLQNSTINNFYVVNMSNNTNNITVDGVNINWASSLK